MKQLALLRCCVSVLSVIIFVLCIALSERAHAQPDGFFERELTFESFTTENGQRTVLALPTVYSQTDAKRRLIGGTHRGSLARDALRQQRYEQALRRLIYQPDLPRSALAAQAQSTLRKLGVTDQTVEAAQAAFLVLPELIDGNYVFPEGSDGAVAKAIKPLLTQLGSDSSHLAQLVEVAPAVLQGASLVNDFLLYKALATDVAVYRMQAIKSHVVNSSRTHPMDPALLHAINVVERELTGMLSADSWRAVADTARRNQGDLVGAGGNAILGAGLKKLGTANPGMLVFSGTVWGVSRLANHIEAAQLATTTATIGWRMEVAAGSRSGNEMVVGLITYSKYVYADAMYDTSTNAMARIRDALTSGRPYAEMREHYDGIKQQYLRLMTESGKHPGVRFPIRYDDPSDATMFSLATLLDDPNPRLRAAAISPDGDLLALSCIDGNISFVEPTSGQVRSRVNAVPNGANALTFSNDGKILAASFPGATINNRRYASELRLFEVTTGNTLATYSPRDAGAANGVFTGVVFSPTNEQVAGTLFIDDGRNQDRPFVLDIQQNTAQQHARLPNISGLCWGPGGRWLAIGVGGQAPRLWNLRQHSGVNLQPVAFSLKRYDIAISSDNNFLAVGDMAGAVVVWNLNSGEPVILSHPEARSRGTGRTQVRFSPDSAILATSQIGATWAGSTVSLWDPRNGYLLHQFEETDVVRPAQFSSSNMTATIGFSSNSKWLYLANNAVVRWQVPDHVAQMTRRQTTIDCGQGVDDFVNEFFSKVASGQSEGIETYFVPASSSDIHEELREMRDFIKQVGGISTLRVTRVDRQAQVAQAWVTLGGMEGGVMDMECHNGIWYFRQP